MNLTEYEQRMFTSLPVEVIIRVLSLLECAEILRCSETCQFFHKLVATSIELQYILTLSAEGLISSFPASESSSTNPLSIRSRLDILADYSTAWRTAKHKRTISIVEHYDRIGWQFQVMDGVAVLMAAPRLIIYWLPSRTQDSTGPQRITDTEDGEEGMGERNGIVRKVFEDVEALPMCWGFDPSQDLLVVIDSSWNSGNGSEELIIQARTLSGNKPHPGAKMADVPWPGGEARCPDQIDVVGDVVVFSSKWLEEAVVWDWRNGEFIATNTFNTDLLDNRGIARLVHRPRRHGTNPTFSSISPTTFLSTSKCNYGSLNIYAFAPSSSKAQLIATLNLPPLQADIYPLSIRVIERATNTTPTSDFPFEATPKGRIHWVTVGYASQAILGGLLLSYSFIVHSRIIQSLIESYENQIDEKGSARARNLEWEEWGPQNTRIPREMDEDTGLFLTSSREDAAFDVTGQRAAFAPGEGKRVFIEAGHHLKRTVQTTFSDQNIYTKTVLDESVLQNLHIFTEPVVTRLPYQITVVSEAGEDPTCHMLDHRHLVALFSTENAVRIEVTVL